jgi:hypothetical protein
MAVTHHENGIHLSQKLYSEEMLPQFQLSSSHPCSTSLNRAKKLRQNSASLRFSTWYYSQSAHRWLDHVTDAGYQARPPICNVSSFSVSLSALSPSSCSPPWHPQVHLRICTPATAPNMVFGIHCDIQGFSIIPAPHSKEPIGYRDLWLHRGSLGLVSRFAPQHWCLHLSCRSISSLIV